MPDIYGCPHGRFLALAAHIEQLYRARTMGNLETGEDVGTQFHVDDLYDLMHHARRLYDETVEPLGRSYTKDLEGHEISVDDWSDDDGEVPF